MSSQRELRPDDPSEGEPTRPLEPVCAALNAVCRWQALREQVRRGISEQLDATDTAVLVSIGLLGALPLRPPANMSARLQGILGMAVLTRGHLASQLSDGTPPPVRELLDLLGMSGDSGAQFASWFGTAQAAGFIPDLEDGFETMETAALTNWWCRRRGWEPQTQVFHEAKALAYAVNAVVGAWFNPDPLAFGLTAWHVWNAIRASRKLTQQLRDLTELTITQVRTAQDEYDHAVAITVQSQPRQLPSRPFGTVDDISLLFPPSRSPRS